MLLRSHDCLTCYFLLRLALFVSVMSSLVGLGVVPWLPTRVRLPFSSCGKCILLSTNLPIRLRFRSLDPPVGNVCCLGLRRVRYLLLVICYYPIPLTMLSCRLSSTSYGSNGLVVIMHGLSPVGGRYGRSRVKCCTFGTGLGVRRALV